MSNYEPNTNRGGRDPTSSSALRPSCTPSLSIHALASYSTSTRVDTPTRTETFVPQNPHGNAFKSPESPAHHFDQKVYGQPPHSTERSSTQKSSISKLPNTQKSTISKLPNTQFLLPERFYQAQALQNPSSDEKLPSAYALLLETVPDKQSSLEALNTEGHKKKKEKRREKHGGHKHKKRHHSPKVELNQDDAMWVEKKVAQTGQDIFVGPTPLVAPDLKLQARYGGKMMPGEGEAISAYVKEGKRIPRRGEVGLEPEEIQKFEKLGYVMSGTRSEYMNMMRIQKEEQVKNMEDRRNFTQKIWEERALRENKIVGEFRALLQDRLKAKSKVDERSLK